MNSKLNRHFYRNPELAFKDGFFLRKKSKRVNDGLYWKYHYFLPASMMPVIKFLKGYFEIIDSIVDVPIIHRYRNSKMEYATTAIDVLCEIRNRLAIGDEMILGSEFLNPCPWAVLGDNLRHRLARKEFRSMKQLFKYYECQILSCRGYNCTVILHRQDQVLNRLELIAEKERKSVNLILAVALSLLYDIIKNCGPDCNELKKIFTNDRRASRPEVVTTWAQTCTREQTPSGQSWSIARNKAAYDASFSNVASKKYEAPPYSYKYDREDFMRDHHGDFQKITYLPAFSDVELVDFGFTALVTNEVTYEFGEIKKNKNKTISSNGHHDRKIEIEDIDSTPHMGANHIKMIESWMGYHV